MMLVKRSISNLISKFMQAYLECKEFKDTNVFHQVLFYHNILIIYQIVKKKNIVIIII